MSARVSATWGPAPPAFESGVGDTGQLAVQHLAALYPDLVPQIRPALPPRHALGSW
ncbi:hypothetical protein [Nocardia sp. NPDC049707]|uniref:hypothetical protein n=1 Tax=Nocardia sp. NPDC049707 TaxID=3154735 RepID=UPI00341C747C